MKAADVLRALGKLAQGDREAHHNIHAIWWLVRDLGSTGDVERLLWMLWEQFEVENPADGRWRLPTRADVQLALEETP